MGKKRITKINGKILTQGGNPGELRSDELDVNVGTDGSISITDNKGNSVAGGKVAKQYGQKWAKYSNGNSEVHAIEKDTNINNIVLDKNGVSLPCAYDKLPITYLNPIEVVKIVHHNQYIDKDITYVLQGTTYTYMDTYTANNSTNSTIDYESTFRYNPSGNSFISDITNRSTVTSGNFKGHAQYHKFTLYLSDGTEKIIGDTYKSKAN